MNGHFYMRVLTGLPYGKDMPIIAHETENNYGFGSQKDCFEKWMGGTYGLHERKNNTAAAEKTDVGGFCELYFFGAVGRISGRIYLYGSGSGVFECTDGKRGVDEPELYVGKSGRGNAVPFSGSGIFSWSFLCRED